MEFEIKKISVERVFNIGNYQTIRFGMEVATEGIGTNEEVTTMFKKCLAGVENSFNEIMAERSQPQQQQPQPSKVITIKKF